MARRRISVLAGGCALALVLGLAQQAHSVAAGTTAPFFGILEMDGTHLSAERSAGVDTALLELGWKNYEPNGPGQVDPNYLSWARSRLAAYKQAGFKVVLEAGLASPPTWVYNLDANTHFVNQYGDVYGGTCCGNPANGVWDNAVRNAEAGYIAQLAQDLGDSFDYIRVGGLESDELRLPGPSYNGHTNSYWAFDANAQAGSPVPGWKPGQAGVTQATQFLTYYLQSLTNFQDFLLQTYRSHFSAWLEVLYPSWGLRPGDATNAENTLLDGSTAPAGWGTLAMGLDWADQVAALHSTDSHAMAYTTWLERKDDGTTANTASPARYLTMLAQPLGVPVAGENAGVNDTLTDMATCFSFVQSLGMAGIMWMNEQALVSGTNLTLADYATEISTTLSALSLSPSPSPSPTPSPTPAPTPTPTTSATPTPTPSPSPTPKPGKGRKGYLVADSSGGVHPLGQVAYYGDASALHLAQPMVGAAATGDGSGYWLVAGDGGIFSYGDAGFHGSTGGMHLNRPLVGMAPTADSRGYWLVASDGGIFAFGDAGFHGSTGNLRLNQPVVGMAATPDGAGYWLVARDGGIFAFGDAGFYGSTGAIHLNQPIVAMAPTPDGHGYWLVASDGGVFAFGDAGFFGSTGGMRLNAPVTTVTPSPDGHGYWLLGGDGGVFAFGDAPSYGSAAGQVRGTAVALD